MLKDTVVIGCPKCGAFQTTSIVATEVYQWNFPEVRIDLKCVAGHKFWLIISNTDDEHKFSLEIHALNED